MTKHNPEELFSLNAQALRPSAIEDIHKLLEEPGMRSLAGAWPDPLVFQTQEISDIIVRLLDDKGGEILQYGSTKGNPQLRQVLADTYGQREGTRCSPDQILVTSGSAQGLDLACRVFVNPGDIVLVGLPSYFGGTATIAANGGLNVGIPVDERGLRIDILEERLTSLQNANQQVKGVYVIPNFQNPTGVTLSLDRRRKLLELAERFRFMIFEDDPYGELRFDGEHLPSLLTLDDTGCVVHFHSTSKTFSPGMRVAWVAGQAAVIARMERSKQASDISTNTLAQMVLLEFIKTGNLQRGIEHNRAHYRNKRDLMLGLIEDHFPEEVSWTRPSGGFFTFITLPQRLHADDLLAESLKHRIAYVSGPAFFVDGGGQNSFRLSYSQASVRDINEAIPVLAGLIKESLYKSAC